MALNGRWLLVSAVGVLILSNPVRPVTAAAADAPPLRFGCSGRPSPENRVEYERTLSFEATTLKALESDRALPRDPSHFGPFDTSRYGFKSVEFFVDSMPVAVHNGKITGNGPATVRLLAHLRGSALDSWWRLRQSVDRDLESSMSRPRWQAPSQPAGADEPLFLFPWTDSSEGMGASCSWTHEYVLDFRSATPSVPVRFECGDCDSMGACNGPDASFEPRPSFDCGWDPTRKDFLCTQTTAVATGWADWAFRSYFGLLANAEIGYHSLNPGGPTSLADVARWLRDGRAKVGTTVIVPGLGPVTPLAARPEGSQGFRRFLLASPGPKCQVAFRFYVATVLPAGEIDVKPIPSRRLNDELELERAGDQCGDFDPRGTRINPQPSFLVREMGLDSDGVRLIRILVQEGRGHWVYLIALDGEGPETHAESLLLATDTADYAHCWTFHYSPQMVPTATAIRPFRVTVEIEPAHRGYLAVPPGSPVEAGEFSAAYGSEEDQAAAPLSLLTWTRKDGFVLSPIGEAPAEPGRPRFVVIDQSGEITLHTPLLGKGPTR